MSEEVRNSREKKLIEQAWINKERLLFPSLTEDEVIHKAFLEAWKELGPELIEKHGKESLVEILEFGEKTGLDEKRTWSFTKKTSWSSIVLESVAEFISLYLGRK